MKGRLSMSGLQSALVSNEIRTSSSRLKIVLNPHIQTINQQTNQTGLNNESVSLTARSRQQ